MPPEAPRILNLEARTHGRVLVRDRSDPTAVVIGFHGYMEDAEIQMARLERIPGSERWTLVSVQALHRFYRGRTQTVSASWMTRQDRELMIADNIEYANRVIDAAVPAAIPLVAAGFSQGVAMAFRTAVRGQKRCAAVVAVGGDVPPELLADAAAVFPPVLLLRGRHDDWYTANKLDADVAALETRGVPVRAITYEGAHEWNDAVGLAASAFIAGLKTVAG
jgi:predicted esterase